MTSTTRCQVLALQVFLLFASVMVAEVLAETEPLQSQKQDTVHPHHHSHHHHPHHHHHNHHHSGKHHSHEEWSLHEKENKTGRGRVPSHWRFQNVIKEIVNRSDVKTVILAKDSTFNFFPENYYAHVDVHKKINTVVDSKNDDVVSPLPHVSVPDVFMATAIEQNVEDSTTQQNGDVTEAPPTPGGFHPLDVEITSSSIDTAGSETVTGGNAGDAPTPEGGETTSSRDVEVTSSVGDATGSETFTEGTAGEGNFGVVASTIEPTESEDKGVLVTEEVLSGRINEKSYVFIKSLLPVKNQGPDVSLVLDIDFEDTKAEDGSRKIVLSTNDQALSEQWLIDNQTTTIRNRQKNLCISYSDSHQLIASPCNVTSKRQMWLYDHNRRALHNPFYDFVAEVGKFGDPEAAVGDHVQVMAYDGSPTQHFDLGTLPFFFVLVNEETGLALSVFEDRDRPGTKLVLALLQSPPSKGQLWYFDSREVLRSKINDNVIDSSSDTFRSEPFSYEAVDTTSWTFFDHQIINLKDERQVMEPVSTPDDEELVLAPRRHHDEKIGQKFKIVYPTAAKTDAAAPEIITATSPGPLSEISPAV